MSTAFYKQYYIYVQRAQIKCIHILRNIYVKCVYIFWHPPYIYIYICTVHIHIYICMYRGCQKIYTHFKRFCLCKMCIHFLAPSVHIYILYIYIYTVHTHTHIYICTEGAKKCIHILRDVIYVKCVYIFGTLCTYTYMYSTHTHIYMYSTHTYIYICVCVCMYWGCQKMYTNFT